jgi:hypothetical protein
MCLPTLGIIRREFAHKGLLCAVTQSGKHHHLCGYVRVPPGHPLHGKDFQSVDLHAHGGVNFSEPEPCEHEDGQGWWFGFDCAHSGDMMIRSSLCTASVTAFCSLSFTLDRTRFRPRQ